MRRPVLAIVLALALAALALPAGAQLPSFGNAFPLTNTRYGSTSGTTLLRTDGRNAFLFWSDNALRVTRLAFGTRRIGRPVFETTPASADHIDAVWTGSHFVVATAVHRDLAGRIDILGRLVDANGHPAGDVFTMASNASQPRLAFNGTTLLMLYASTAGIHAQALNELGRPVSDAVRIADSSPWATAVAAASTRFAAMVSNESGDHLMMFDATGRFLSRRRISDHPSPSWSIASDGHVFFALQCIWPSAIATLFDANGETVRTTTLDSGDPGFFRTEGAVWTGSRWAVAYAGSSNHRIAEVDPAGQTVVSRQDVDATTLSFTSVDGRIVASWRTANAVHASELPLAPERIETVAYGASVQQILATASAADATLVVWRETADARNAVRAGVRTRDGSWREQEIATNGFTALAASDGSDYVVILNGNTLIRLNARGIPLPGDPAPIPDVRPQAIAWNGRNYAVTGFSTSGQIVTARLSAGGVWSQPNEIPASWGFSGCASIASNGDGFLITCFVPAAVIILGSPPAGLAAIHLDADARPAGAPITLTSNTLLHTLRNTAWNGSSYVVGWNSMGEVIAAHVGKTEVESRTRIASQAQGEVHVTAADGGAWLGWTGAERQYHLAFVRPDGSATAPVAVATPDPAFVQLTTIDEAPAYVHSSPQRAEPHYGAPRVMMGIASFALPSLPDAPRLTVRKDGNVARLEWSAPPQRVSGYRLEYRVDDGLWLELEEWFDAERRALTFPLHWPAAAYSFRVRAFSDAGAGAYSSPVAVNPVRRRAVR